ncbi:MAG: glycosyltransferase family 39 protein [Anaerolineales bacterium]|nr:glycosyltransferase family 39 protein [Anaerolineales bacterium]
MLLITVVAAVLRLWQLDHLPPGLYRDEAYNGLDALEVLAGNWQLYFANNNGREPFYIYLTAVSVGLFGRAAWAVRLGAAVVGTLTTLTVYQLGKSWFDERIGFLSAWLWAVTVWPVHLSRIGFRTVTVVPFLALSAWLLTVAYKRQRPLWWVTAGLVYGLGYYTYLAIRFTPLLLLLAFLYLWWLGVW